MPSSRLWKPTPLPSELAGLSDELDRTFAIEKALLTAGLSDRIQAALPRVHTPILRMARALAAIVVLGSLGVAGLSARLLARPADAPDLLRLVLGGCVVLVALLITFAAPNLARIEERLARRWARAPAPRENLIVRFRLTAAGLLVLGAGVLCQ